MARYRSRNRSAQRRESRGPTFRADLHMHSVRSDGCKPPEDMLKEAARGGLQVIALTDHDIDPILPSGLTSVGDKVIHIIHGVELSGHHDGSELHLLAYFPEEMPQEFRVFCRELCRRRARRYDSAIENLGMDLPRADEAAHEGFRSLTRTHLAKEMLRCGFVQSYDEAFRHHLKRKDVVPLIELSFLEAISIAKEHGAFLSWAHPSIDQARSYSKLFAVHGLDALEVIRPKQSKGTRRTLRAMAQSLNIEISGGSDSHGYGAPLGSFAFSGWEMTWANKMGIDPTAFQ